MRLWIAEGRRVRARRVIIAVGALAAMVTTGCPAEPWTEPPVASPRGMTVLPADPDPPASTEAIAAYRDEAVAFCAKLSPSPIARAMAERVRGRPDPALRVNDAQALDALAASLPKTDPQRSLVLGRRVEAFVAIEYAAMRDCNQLAYAGAGLRPSALAERRSNRVRLPAVMGAAAEAAKRACGAWLADFPADAVAAGCAGP